jgi:hypothetical protein
VTGRCFWRKALKLTAGAALAMAVVALGTANAGIENAGTTAANFLSIGSSARVLGMGGATLGLGDDLGASAWNPAAAGWLNGYEGALAHAALPSRSTQEWGAVGGRIGASRSRWAVAGLYQGEGSLEGRDVTGASTGSFSVSSMAFGATLAQQIGTNLTLGVAAKVVSEKLATVSGSGFTFDAGLLAHAGPFGFGVAAQNLGGHMGYGGATYPFPSSYGAGVAYSHPGSGVRVAVDANLPSAYHPDLRVGAEWLHRGLLALRVGYRKELVRDADPLNGPTFGVGARAGSMWIDYAYLLSVNGTGQHRMGLRFQRGGGPLGAADPKREPRPNDFDWARDGSRMAPAKPTKP